MKMNNSHYRLAEILDKAQQKEILDRGEIVFLLGLRQKNQTFVPQQGTPMQSWKRPDPLREMMTIAVLRLSFPDRLIPATLDVAGLTGLQSRLEAGANVVTSLVPPGFGLAGVAQNSLDIADARRSEEHTSELQSP